MTTRSQQQLLRRSLSYLSSVGSTSSSIRPVSTMMISASGSTLASSSLFDRWQQPPQLQSQFDTYYSTATTRFMQAVVHKDSLAAQPTEEEKNETEDTIPVWANPRHVNDPDMKKMFPEDFQSEEEMSEAIVPLPPLEDSEDKVVAPPHLHQLAHEIVHGLNLLELRELTDKIADHFGFDDEMMAASYGGGGGGGVAAGDGDAAAEEVVEAKTIFDLKLVAFDAKAKIKVIKEVRTIAGLGLKEAKELVESAPKVIQKDLKQEKADELKAQLEAVGAEIELV
mmetsp:Transcript_9091/g.23012  ORF Transcript_9091/g.23012 Transcript_9091/m.23012 type:complete len:282 (+) Transcript_9091:43-888(+)